MIGEEQTAESLDNFGGWESESDIPTPVQQVEEVIDAVENDDVITEEEGNQEETSSREEEVVEDFGDWKIEDEDDENQDDDFNQDDNPSNTTTTSSMVSTVNLLKEKGFIDFELEDGVELDDELAAEIIEDGWEDAIDREVGEKMKDLPEALKKMVKYSLDGGDFTELLAGMTQTTSTGITKDLDMENEANQELVMTHNLKEQGYDDDYIKANIQTLKDTGKLKSVAASVQAKFIKEDEKREADKLARAEEIKRQNKENQRNYKAGLSEQLKEITDIKGIVINDSDKKELPSYIGDINVKLTDGRLVSKMQQDLFKVFGDKEKTLLLAKLLQSDFDFSSVANTAVSQNNRQIRKNVQNAEQGNIKSKGSSQSRQKKNLADFF